MFKMTPLGSAMALALASLALSLSPAAARADEPLTAARVDAAKRTAAAELSAPDADASTTSIAQAATPTRDAPPIPAGTDPASPQELPAITIRSTVDKLDAARNSLSPETGSTIYKFTQRDIANLPLGDATPLNQVLLRAPGVVQDSFAAGQLHVRGDHGNLQYRINGVIVPESVSGFAQAIDTRFADSISLLTGALPAQYGYRTAGVVDIRTKGQTEENGGSIDVTVGSHDHREVSGNVQGTTGGLTYFLSGSYLASDQGIENPTSSRDALHDDTRQAKGFAYFSYLLDADSRVSLMLANSNSRFQIPNVPGQSPIYQLGVLPALDSSTLDANQSERNDFQVLSYQSKLNSSVDYQVSVFRRRSDVHYLPDPVGDLTYTGVASNVYRHNTATGLQFDLSDRLSEQHTLRGGVFLQRERGGVDNTSSVFPANADGTQSSTTPVSISDNASLGGHLYGVYLQDEWTPIEALTINFGARYDKVSTVVDESQWSPRLGAVYQLDTTTRLHAGYARYFTPPPTERIDATSVQAFLGTTNALPSDANTAVRSERSDYFDLGISKQVTPQLTLGADAYYRQVKHLQDEGQFGSAFVYSAFNYDQGRIYGLELSASYQDRGFSAYGNLAMSAARGKGIETGQFNFDSQELAYIQNNWVHLDHEEKVTASAGVAYRFTAATQLSVDALFGSGLRNGFANTEHLPSHLTFNAGASHAFNPGSASEFTTRLSMINVFDRTYQLRDGSGISVGAPQYGLGRAVYLTVSKPFTF
ncbi:MAG: TonB-dependent receptor [Rhizobacter sp.]|nr:TonB-dependent receptor [Rhizobacter sp.]